MFIYIVERLLRVYRASLPVSILSISLMDDVLSLEFAKEGIFEFESYKEGQYLFLQSPPVSRIQWHPFTISSAPEEKTVTVHIRVSNEGSWTRELCAYISAMGPRGKPFFALDRQGPQGKLQGKIIGPDGKVMLCVDGPHSVRTHGETGDQRDPACSLCVVHSLAHARSFFAFWFVRPCAARPRPSTCRSTRPRW